MCVTCLFNIYNSMRNEKRTLSKKKLAFQFYPGESYSSTISASRRGLIFMFMSVFTWGGWRRTAGSVFRGSTWGWRRRQRGWSTSFPIAFVSRRSARTSARGKGRRWRTSNTRRGRGDGHAFLIGWSRSAFATRRSAARSGNYFKSQFQVHF